MKQIPEADAWATVIQTDAKPAQNGAKRPRRTRKSAKNAGASFERSIADWLRDRLHTGAKNDRQLETALSMLERYGVIELIWEPLEINVVGALPPELMDRNRLANKLRRDQQKLYSLVELVRHEGDRREFLREYFGLAE